MQQDFFHKMELEKGLKRWVSGLTMWPKKGVLRAAHPRYTFQCELSGIIASPKKLLAYNSVR